MARQEELLYVAPRLRYLEDLIAQARVVVVGSQVAAARGAMELGAREVVWVRSGSDAPAGEGIQEAEAPREHTGLPGGHFDVAITFDYDPASPTAKGELAELRRLLTDEGLLYLAPRAEGYAPGSTPLTELRSELRRHFPNVEVLTLQVFAGVMVGPDPRALPTWARGLPGPELRVALLCSRLLIVPEEQMLVTLPMDSVAAPQAPAALPSPPPHEPPLNQADLDALHAQIAVLSRRVEELEGVEVEVTRLKAERDLLLEEQRMEIEALRSALRADVSRLDGEGSSDGGPVPDEVWSPPEHGERATPIRVPPAPPAAWQEMLDEVQHEPQGWDTPQEGDAPTTPSESTDGELWSSTPSEGEDSEDFTISPFWTDPRKDPAPAEAPPPAQRPQEGEMAMLEALHPDKLGELPDVTRLEGAPEKG